jgi:hypothetical protein
MFLGLNMLFYKASGRMILTSITYRYIYMLRFIMVFIIKTALNTQNCPHARDRGPGHFTAIVRGTGPPDATASTPGTPGSEVYPYST